MVLHWLKEVQLMPAVNGGAQDSGPALQAILKKEAVYNAVSVGQYGLQDSINWTDWLRTTLLKVHPCPSTLLCALHLSTCFDGLMHSATTVPLAQRLQFWLSWPFSAHMLLDYLQTSQRHGC